YHYSDYSDLHSFPTRRSSDLLSDLDEQCGDYIAHYANSVSAAPVPAKQSDLTLAQAIEKGLKERASELTAELIQTKEALDLINEQLIPALDRVGKGFEKGTIFLPQLLMSAEAAKAAFEVIKTEMEKSGQ